MKIKAMVTDPRLHSFGLPEFTTPGSAAIDIRAMLPTNSIILAPGQTCFISSGLRLWIDDSNYAGFLLPRSGLGAKEGLVIGNLTGLIDSDYQGDLMIAAWNRNLDKSITINHGDRIAQFLIQPVVRFSLDIVDFDKETTRGAGGYGHSGVK